VDHSCIPREAAVELSELVLGPYCHPAAVTSKTLFSPEFAEEIGRWVRRSDASIDGNLRPRHIL